MAPATRSSRTPLTTPLAATPIKTTKTGRISKRAPLRAATLPSDVFVARDSSSRALVLRCIALLKNPTAGKAVLIQGLGAMISKAITVALEVEEAMGGSDKVDVNVETTTVDLIDDVIEENDEEKDDTAKVRKNSAIKIRIRTK
ncbi:hypothetical protein HDU98_007747 [Podochytrium sp. JEL0797]|nr:hypothetical protein HDU98_007747 [Podochytrium sp. JEL0797]